MSRTLPPAVPVERTAVVLTAVGAVTGHGVGIEPLLEAVLAARTAVRPVRRFSTEGLCSSLGAEAPHSLEGLRDASDARTSRASELLLAAAASVHAGREWAPSERRAVVVGSTKGALEWSTAAWEAGQEAGSEDILGAPAVALARALAARGPVYTVGAACASSMVALGEALALIRRGACDEVVVGGVDALSPFVYRGFHALKALSATPARPFDAHRSGLSLGEGAAVLLLESEAHARARGAEVLARIEGYGTALDGFDQTAPEPTGRGLIQACRRAMEQAGRTVSEVHRFHAHGTGTLQNDRMEAAAHAALFGGRAVPVTGIKGSIGHTLGASAALDVLVAAKTLALGLIPPVTGLAEVDPAARVPAVMGMSVRDAGTLALITSAGFGGLNAALLISVGEHAR